MARTVLVEDKPSAPYIGPGACDFCSRSTKTGVKHELCPGEIQNAAGSAGSVWACACNAAGHGIGA